MRPTAYLSVTALIATVPALSAQVITPRQPLARIGDEAIYEDDLLPSIGPQLVQLKNQEYELRSKALEHFVNQRLLEKEAQGLDLSLDAFLAQKVYQNVPPPNASEIEAYYRDHTDPLGRPFDEIKAQLQLTVRQRKAQEARREYLASLQRKARVSFLYSRPRVEVVTDPLRTRGKPDAPITIVEFADFECPYSQQVEETLRQVMDKYESKVRFAFLDFPLKKIHPLAEQAAEASRCAGEQGKFWEYRNRLLVKDARLGPNGLREHAQGAGLDPERFRACLESRKFAASVEKDILTGYKSGVVLTPSFFVNGLPLPGTQPASSFEEIIASELENARLNSAR